MELLLLLLGAHVIGDFYLQPKSWIDCRLDNRWRSPGLRKHIAVHMALSGLAFAIAYISISTKTPNLTNVANLTAGQAIMYGFAIVMTIGISHFLIDWWKSTQLGTLPYFIIDQCLHIFVIIAVWMVMLDHGFTQAHQIVSILMQPQSLLLAMAYILVCRPASIIISIALKRHTDAIFTEQASSNHGLEAAGRWIGYLERCLAITFIFMGQFSGIGFLVAAKTIFRFGDLTKSKDMKLTEYMLLGTLLSYGMALTIGWLTAKLYSTL